MNKRLFYLLLPVSLLFSISCDKLAEQDTPLCKDCHSIVYKSGTDSVIVYKDTTRLCGGDVLAWESIEDIETDSTTEKHFCIK
ncbi:MAG: hypothetical protein JXR58_10025 [Bacteroidales bacterium]|nr:hypothetical protein [Bacteroidales bacterium]